MIFASAMYEIWVDFHFAKPRFVKQFVAKIGWLQVFKNSL